MINGLGYKLANVPTITGLSTVTADNVVTDVINTDSLYIDGVDVSSIISQVPINTANIATLQQITTGQSYSNVGAIDTTTFDNNVNINYDLDVSNNITCSGLFIGATNVGTAIAQIPINTSNIATLQQITTGISYDNTLSADLTTIDNNVKITKSLDVFSHIDCGLNLTVGNILRAEYILNDKPIGQILIETGSGAGSIQIKPETTLVIEVNATEVDFYKPLNLNSQNIIGGGTITATTFSGSLTGNASTATNISGGTGGALLYQSGANTTAKLPIGTSTYVLTSNGSNPVWSPPATPATPTLANVLLAGNSAGSTSIDMNTQNITNAGTITATNFTGLASQSTTVAVADNNTATTMYPTFCTAVAGQKSLLFDTTTGPLSYIPSSGLLNSLQYSIGGNALTAGSNSSLLYQGSSALGIQNYATSGVTNFHTYDGSNVLGTRLQISSGAVQANVPLSIFDSATSDNLFLQATAGGGSWNPSTINGSSLMFAKSSAIDLQSLSLTVWSNTNTGVQITPTYSRISHGGGTTPTSYLQVASGTTTVEGTTINLSSTTTKLQITSSQVQSTVPLIVTDSATSDELGFNAVTTVGNQNPITQAGSSLIYAKTATIGNQSLTLTCWSATTSGVFISPLYTSIGYGGTTSIPTSNITFTGSASTISGTNININNNNFQFGTSTACNVGYGAGGVSNLIIGNASASYTTNYTAGQNTVIGNDSCASVTTNFAGNVAVGYGTMNIATSATNCIAIGNLAGSGLTSGSSNTFVGSGAGFQSATAGTGSSNTCIGNSAGNGIATSANGNTLVGSGCASAMTATTNNTCLGSNSGDNITTGSSNTCIGSFSTVPNPTGNGQIAIGTASDTMYIRGGLNWSMYNPAVGINANITLTFPFNQLYVIVAGPLTITLPIATTAMLGAHLIFKRILVNQVITFNVTGGGASIIRWDGITGATTALLSATQRQTQFSCNGSIWYQLFTQ